MPIHSETFDIEAFLSPDDLASDISKRWEEYDSYRQDWKNEKVELRNYLYATDTSTTANSRLEWSNSTTAPKLTQIYDNLKANYTAALFPNEKWLSWEANSHRAEDKEKANAAQAYIRTKVRQDRTRDTIDELLDDYIQFGNCFATVEWVSDYVTRDKGLPTQETVRKYVGPRLVRISPYDIVFNPTAAHFKVTPKIVRSLVTLGTLHKMGINVDTIDKVKSNRVMVNNGGVTYEKTDGYVADGFGSIEQYYSSGYVEILTFYGDIYDKKTKEFRENRIIKVVDRAYIVSDEEVPSYFGDDAIFHAGWRSRPDNLYAMGPLDNLVGMQYRMDHLENLKADVFDMIALPILKIRGDPEEFDYAPGEKIVFSDPDGDCEFLAPQAVALQADNQIAFLQNQMEEFAGAPRLAMGIRTPGEKTAFEVQTLDSRANRIFEHKAAKFEAEFLEPLLNSMLELAIRNLNVSDTIGVFSDQINMEVFREITREDIRANGRLRPVGARHFAEQQRRIGNINNLIGIKLNDPSIGAHLSGKKIAQLLAEEIEEAGLFEPNVMVQEQMELQSVAEDAEADHMEELSIKQEQGL